MFEGIPMHNSAQSGRVQRVTRKKKPTRRITWRRVQAAMLGVSLGLAAFVLLSLAALISVNSYIQIGERIMPGVQVGSVSVGNMTSAEAADAVAAGWTTEQTITLTGGGLTRTANPADFGLGIDAQATVQRAYAAGREPGFVQRMLAVTESLLFGYSIEPVAGLDENVARTALEAVYTEVYVAPQDARLVIESGTVQALPAVPGQVLDVEATLGVLSYAPGVIIKDGTLPLVMMAIPAQVQDISGLVAEAEQILSTPLNIDLYDAISNEHITWTEDRAVVAAWLTAATDEAGQHLSIDQDALAQYLNGLETTLGGGRFVQATEDNIAQILDAARSGQPAEFLIRHRPTTYTVQSGDTMLQIGWNVGIPYWRILDANPDVIPDHLEVGQVLTIPSHDDLLPLPVVPGKRIVVNLSLQRLRIYQDDLLTQEFVISTGIEDSPTQPGVFQVQTHEENAYASNWDLIMPDFIGIYEAWPGFMNGFHALPSRNGGQVLWAESLGRPTSFGCIILDFDDAAWLYDWAEDGVVVEIVE